MPVRRRYHFHTPGIVYVFITLLVAIGAFNSQNNLLFWAFGFALAILIVSGIISGQMLMGIRASRTLPPRATVGEPVPLTYRINNRSHIAPAFAIGVAEHHTSSSAPAASRPRPRWWQLRRRFGGPKPSRAFTFLVHLGPGEHTELVSHVTPTRRGTLRFLDYSLETTFPFGLIRKSLLFREERTVLVRPRQTPPPPDLFARRRSGGLTATPRAARSGGGDDFFTLREYVPGDSPRTIAWRASARGQHTLVRQNSEPVPQRLIVLLHLDASHARSDQDPVNEAAISLAAGVVTAAVDARYEVGMAVPLAGLERRPSQGRAQAVKLLDDLALIDLAAPAPVRANDPATVPIRAARGTLVVVVHAGPVNRAFGPPGAVHLSALAEEHAAELAADPREGGPAPRPKRPLRATPAARPGPGGPRP